MHKRTYNWGIVAPGNIAQQFAKALQATPGAQCWSVASRDQIRAESFAKDFGFNIAAKDYQSMLADPDLDIVYIASPHHCHAEQSIQALQAGKHVVCEKPFVVNSKEAQLVTQAARQSKCFFMEAVWTRFLPIYDTIKQWRENEIGELQAIIASFGIAPFADPKHRINNPDLAGGALLDLGIYPITLADYLLNAEPEKIKATTKLGSTGVDNTTSIQLRYESGVVASLLCSSQSELDNQGWIFGTKGKIQIPNFWCAESATLYQQGGEPTTIFVPHTVNGYEFEIEEIQHCLERNQTESKILPLDISARVMLIMDDVRQQIGLRYPFES